MDTLMHADIFFFVTTVMVVLVGIALTVVLIYLAQVLRRVREIMYEVKEETVLVREDIHELRDQVRRGGAKLKFFTDFIQNLLKLKLPRSKKK